MFDDPETNIEPRLGPYFLKEYKNTQEIGHGSDQGSNFRKGTTSLALLFKDGVIIAADRRVSAGFFNASKDFQKIHEITGYMAMGTAGGVADAQALVDLMRAELKIYNFDNDYKPTVKVATSLLATILHSGYRRYQPYLVQLLVAGYDQTGPHIYNLGPAGSILDDPIAVIGSGSYLAMGVLDSDYKKDMNREEAEALAIKALKAAISRDLATGDGIDYFVITKDKMEFKQVEITNLG